jgi:GNAT superfamily N-acetyltransferase
VSGLTVRGAGPGDRDAIQTVTLAAYQEYTATIGAHWTGYRQNIIATLAAAAPGTQIVALDDDRVVGAVLLYPAGASIEKPGGTTVTLTWPEVRLLAVAPSARGRGVGSALMNECIHRARRAGAAALTLHTTDLMQAAMRQYERLGFERAHDLDLEPAPGILAKGYRLDLPL